MQDRYEDLRSPRQGINEQIVANLKYIVTWMKVTETECGPLEIQYVSP